MKRFELPLLQLTFTQKLDIMEILWNDLSKDQKAMKSPDWHEDILDDRDKAFSDGALFISDWEEAKERIRKNVSCKP